jgi:hypothetical protein
MIFEKLNAPYVTHVKDGTAIRWPLFLTIRRLSAADHASFRAHSATVIENDRDCKLFLTALTNYQLYISLEREFSDRATKAT